MAFIDLELIIFFISVFFTEYFLVKCNYSLENAFLIGVIVFLVLGSIVFIFYSAMKKKKNLINNKKRIIIRYILIETAFIFGLFAYYCTATFIISNNIYYKKHIILLSLLAFILFNISFFIIEDFFYNKKSIVLDEKRYGIYFILCGLFALLLSLIMYIIVICLFDKKVAFLLSIITFLVEFIFLTFSDFIKLSERMKSFNEDIDKKITTKTGNRVFISHSGIDKEYSTALYDLMKKIGVPESEIFYSSMAENGIPLHENIYDYLLKQFKDYNLHVIFMLSENYYNSIFCLQEMGAAWVLKHKTDTVLLPTFTEDKIKGSINPNEINIKLDSEDFDLKVRLEQFKDEISEEFEIEKITSIKWERVRDEFIEKVKQISVAE